jgi:hypothetical protein
MVRRVRPARVASRVASAVAALTLAAVVVAGCSNDALALARAACGHVDQSLADWHRALHATGSAAEHDGREALRQLEDALPLAAAATSANGAWNPLQTTLQQSSRTSEGNLVGALRRQCAATSPAHATTTTTPPTTTTS